MGKTIQIGSAVFDCGFLSAQRADGLEVQFTRAESSALAYFTQNTGRVLSRSQLLDAISGTESEVSDRNIDFTINRLRRKLNDPATNPEFIATRYGEGYIWLPELAPAHPMAMGAAAVVGPVHGMAQLGALSAAARTFVDIFFQTYAAGFDSDRKVVLDPACPAPGAFTSQPPETGIDLTFFTENGALECVIRAAAFTSGHTYFTARKTVQNTTSSDPVNLGALAKTLTADIWKSMAASPESSLPLPFSILGASETYRKSRDEPSGEGLAHYKSWRDSDTRLRALLAKNPRDFPTMIMLAANIHTKYILCGIGLFASGADTCYADEDEIEALVTTALPFIQARPELAIIAAKLLYFVNRGHRRAAVDLAEAAHKTGTSMCASLATIGQMRMFLGEAEAGLVALRQAFQLSEAGSRFHAGLSHMIFQALAAVDDRAALNEALAATTFLSPQSKSLAYICYGDFENLPPEITAALSYNSFDMARAILNYSDYLSARLFADPTHRLNLLRPAATLFARKHGAAVLPEAVLVSAPALKEQ